MKPNRIRRNKAIQQEYKYKYDQEGKRHDVICKELGEKYFLSADYIADVVRMDLPELPKSNQVSLFDQPKDNSN